MPPPEDLPDPGIELTSLMSPASAGGFFTTRATWEAHRRHGQRNKCLSLNGAIGKKRISSMRALSGDLSWAGELGKVFGGWLELRVGELSDRGRHRRRCF